LITRRRVVYVPGYDPQGPQGYYDLFGSQLKRACALWHVKFALGPLATESADIACWTVTMGGPNWQVFTRYDFVRYEDIINANTAEPIIRQISRAVRWMLDDLATGTTFRTFRANWQFGMHHLVLQLLLLTWIGTSVASGTLAWTTARYGLGLNASISLAISVAILFAIFMALRPLADRWLVIRVNNHWPYLREFGRGEATCFDRPIEVGAARIKELVNANDADEVVIIGHSGGAPMAQCMVVRALELDPDLGRRGPRIIVLTIGSITPAVAFHPQALKIREIIRRIAIEPSINWIECQSRKDALNFWRVDPVAGIGIQLGLERCNPLVWEVRFRDMLSAGFYRKLRWKLFRLHFQYIMANHMRAPYDYFMLIGSPVPIMEWAKRQRDIVAEFSPEGKYLGPHKDNNRSAVRYSEHRNNGEIRAPQCRTRIGGSHPWR
jgi:pimeloyl-ACP methyl ester carboxylesterase